MKRGAILMGFSFLISKILGLIRDNLLAAQFGAGDSGSAIFNLDTYYAAFRLPDLLFNLMSYGVLSAAFVPLFVEIMKKENRERAFEFSNEILRTVSAGILGISCILWIFAPQLLKLFVPGFVAEDFSVTVALTRIMLVTPVFFTIGSIAGGIQNSLHKFWGLALAPVMYNLGIICGILFLSDKYGVYGPTIGVVLGSFLNAAVQIPAIFKAGFYLKWPKLWFSNRVKEMIKLSLPRILGMSVSQLSLIIDTVIASTLAAGSITVINFASNMESLPIGIIGISIAVVSFGTLSSYAASNNTEALVKTLSDNVRRILFLLIPITVGMFLLRSPIVKLLLGRGKFSETDTIITANTLGIFLAGLAFGGIVFLLARGFYALKNTKTPVVISIVAVAANIMASLIFTKILQLGPYGLALANAIANILNASLLIIFLNKRLRTSILDTKEIFKSVLAASVMGIAVYFANAWISEFMPAINQYLTLIIQISLAVIIGAGVYFGICWILRCRDLCFRRKNQVEKSP